MQHRPLLLIAVKPKTTADLERLRHALATLMGDDPTISVKADEATGECVIGGMGELHLEIIVERLTREFNVEASLGRPQVAYKETITQPADGNGRFIRQGAGRGQYAHAKIHVYPGEPGSGYVFENEIINGAIPTNFIQPVDKGVKEAAARGVLAGYPLDDVRVVLYDGSYHENDSSDMAFKIAGAIALQDAARKAKPVLLEPIMRVEIVVPDDYTADVLENLSRRRGHNESQEDRVGMQRISAHVPLAEMFGYASDLRSGTSGRGSFTMQFERYERVPPPSDQDPDGQVIRGRSA